MIEPGRTIYLPPIKQARPPRQRLQITGEQFMALLFHEGMATIDGQEYKLVAVGAHKVSGEWIYVAEVEL